MRTPCWWRLPSPLNISHSEHCMLHVPTDMSIISRVLLILYMPVATRKPIYYSSIIRNAEVYINAFDSPLYICNICNTIYVTACVPAISTSYNLAHGDAYGSPIHICNNCNIVHVTVCIIVASSLDESLACVTQYGNP